MAIQRMAPTRWLLATGKITKYIRESDFGIYDALNKGIAAATGDVVGVLHADDLLGNREVISSVAAKFEDDAIDAVYGDLVMC